MISADILRWTNVVLSSIVVILLIMGAMLRWEPMPKRIKMMAPWVIATYAVIAYGSGEAAHASNVQPGYRVFLMMLVLIGLIIACLFHMNDPDYSYTGPLGPKMDANSFRLKVPGETMKIFGREPAAVIAAIQALLIMAVSFKWLDFLGLHTQNDVMAVVAVLASAAAVFLAYKTTGTILSPVLELFKALAAVGVIYGLSLTTEQTGFVLATITAIVGLFNRTQVSPLVKGTFDIDNNRV